MRKKPYVEGTRFYLGGKIPYVRRRRLYLGGRKKQTGGFIVPAVIWAIGKVRKILGLGKRKRRCRRR